ncbi:O-antigen ligase family protein [Nesterenkonia marinintestina]|uniref:O-antigen ligase family protein n=1 Tax=Nesterenkonia marinintestina TaxID=2979865 RepID=UPI0021BF15A0|nr:O-antigen ligase [Nesterenkonia sp. GX14115]
MRPAWAQERRGGALRRRDAAAVGGAPGCESPPSRWKSLRGAYFAVYTAFTFGLTAAVLIPVSPDGEVGDNTLFSLVWIVMHMLSVPLLLTARRLDAVGLSLALVVGGYLVASTLWSVSPADSLVYGAMAAGNIIVAYVLATEFTMPQILRMVLAVLLILAVGGMLAHLVGYDQVLDHDTHERENFLGGRRIRGLFTHNIMAGFYCAIGVVLSLALLRGLRRVAALAVFAVFVLLAGSATGLFLMVAAVVLVPLARAVVPRIPLGPLLTVLVPLMVAVGALLWQLWTPLMELLGRDPTMTGRTTMWEFGYSAIAERPLVGWGFNAYFHTSYGEEPSRYVPQFVDYEIAHFHNSYIQTAVDLGIIGLMMLLAVLIAATARSYGFARTHDVDAGVALVMVLAIFLIASPTEFLFFNYNQFGMFMLFVAFFGMLRLRRATSAGTEPVRR